MSFCSRHHISPLPATELTLRYFCTHLSASLAYQTIKVYLAGIRLLHLEHGFADPTRDAPLLQYLCTGIRRTKGDAPKKRSPITLDILHTIKQEMARSHLPVSDRLLYWAAFTVAFYGFLRASEYTAPTSTTYCSRTHLCHRDITVRDDSIRLTLKHSKTDRFGRTAMVLIGATGTSTCPVTAMRKYLGEHPHRHSGPLFTLTSGKFLTRRNVSDVTKTLLSMAGIDPTSYSSHSYRIGAATSAAAAGLSDHLVKTLGRWRSSAYQGYIRTSPQVLCTATAKIARAH